jgi:probable biosynthetic protein (TIGR04099 family)
LDIQGAICFVGPGSRSTIIENVSPPVVPQTDQSPGTASAFGEKFSAISEPIHIGMPHLAFAGLSENWLLKECGHRHWTVLATALGLPKPDFRDAEGNRLYAAFTAVRIHNAQLGLVQDGDELRLLASLGRISRTQWLSNHAVLRGDDIVARVVMISAFLQRTVAGSNRLVQRGTATAASLPSINPDMNGADLAESAHCLRAGNWRTHLGFNRDAAAERATFAFRPCPNNDFNGANFLYFASFQSIVDRAEWRWRLQSGTHPQTKHRELFYHGNLDVDDEVRVTLCAKYSRENLTHEKALWHWCQIFRLSDQKLIADVFTAKSPFASQAASRGR